MHADAQNDPNRLAAGLYDLVPPSSDAQLNPVGEWNTGKIVFNGNRGEHWLNGKRVVEYELGTHMMNRLFAMSKWGDKSEEGSHIPGFNDRRESGYMSFRIMEMMSGSEIFVFVNCKGNICKDLSRTKAMVIMAA